MKHLKMFMQDEEGASAVEYGLLVALIAAVIILAVQTLGGTLNTVFGGVNTALTSIFSFTFWIIQLRLNACSSVPWSGTTFLIPSLVRDDLLDSVFFKLAFNPRHQLFTRECVQFGSFTVFEELVFLFGDFVPTHPSSSPCFPVTCSCI